jgi:hypothetical protein
MGGYKAIVAHLEVSFQHLPGSNEEIQEKLQPVQHPKYSSDMPSLK